MGQRVVCMAMVSGCSGLSVCSLSVFMTGCSGLLVVRYRFFMRGGALAVVVYQCVQI